MKFLHTADLHLGKVFHEQSLIEDQQFMLNKLLETLKDPSYQALVIAGDVYDRSIPPPEAVRLFSPFLGSLKRARPDIEVFLISGNHDSASRLAFGKELFAELGVHFITDPQDADTPIVITRENPYLPSKNSKKETTAFFLLPFLTAGSLKQELSAEAGEEPVPLRSQERLAVEAAARIEKARRAAIESGADCTVLIAHLFAKNGLGSESERVFLGTAELVDIGLFSGFDYIALGHLHKFQKAGPNAYYSGSPLAYSFSETRRGKDAKQRIAKQEIEAKQTSAETLDAPEKQGGAQYEKCFLSVTLESGKPAQVERIPITPLKRVSALSGSFASFFQEKLTDEIKAVQNDYLEISLTDKTLVENPLVLLRQRFPFILSIKQSEAISARLLENSAKLKDQLAKSEGAQQQARNIADDWTDFLIDVRGLANEGGEAGFSEEIAGEIALFREFLAEAERTE